MIDAHGRPGLARVTGAVGRFFARLGVTPDQVTIAGVVLFVPVAVLVATGHTLAGFVAGAFVMLLDLLDGAVAKARGGGSRRGAVLDSVADRVTDALLLCSVAVLLGHRSQADAMLAVAVLVVSYIVSYTRAKASEYDFDAHVGLMERAERSVLIGVGILLQTWWNVLPAILWVVLVLTVVTAAQRLAAVWRQGRAEPPLPAEEVRVLPEWRELRSQLGAEDVRSVLASQRSEWVHRREVARERRLAARAERDRIRREVESADRERRSRRPGQRHRRSVGGTRRP
ncbi:MAG: CDP-alcohol phosphatidyltransferase family protein [Acidimicrobiia bacterium]